MLILITLTPGNWNDAARGEYIDLNLENRLTAGLIMYNPDSFEKEATTRYLSI